jgi:hypothetical protein
MTKITTAREASNIFEILGIKDITTKRQRNNGTTVFELPISTFYGPSNKYPLRFATYASGYVRNVTECNSSPYQCNKRVDGEPEYFDSGKKDSMGRPLYTQFSTRTCVLIPTQQDRLIYLANFVIKNYYKKTTYLISDYTIGTIKSQYRQAKESRSFEERAKELRNKCQCFVNEMQSDGDMVSPDIQVIINGHRYNLS